MDGKNLKTKRTKVKRIPKRGAYDRETINAILDKAFLCHLGFAVEGQPYVIPTSYGRSGDTLYFHGSAASRMLKNLVEGIDCCLTVTICDGLVLARSIFNHSMNYRSVVVLGRAELVTDRSEKLSALERISEQIIPGRWEHARPPTAKELKATSVLRLIIDEASAKVRTGPPIDDDEDYDLDFWAGVVPLRLKAGKTLPDPRLREDIEIPKHVKAIANRF